MVGKQIKLAHIALSLNTGGLEKLVVEFVKNASRRFLPVVCCLIEKGELAQELENAGVKVIAFDKKDTFDTSLIFKLAHFLRKEKITIVHTHNYAPYLYGALAAKIARVPIVIHTEHGVHLYPQIRRKLIIKAISPLVNKVITVSNEVKKAMCFHGYISKNRLVTIPNGINVNEYSRRTNFIAKRGEIGLSEKTQIVGNVARLSPEKDHKTLLEAFLLVSKRVQSVKLIIVGDGILRDELEEEAIALGIKDKVIFLGLRTDVSELLNIFDLFALSSTREGIPLTILEAMTAGLPVVATDVGGVAEVIIDGKTGVIVPPKNPTALAQAIVKILSDKHAAREMGLKGRKRVIENFDIEKTMKEYEKLYKHFVERSNLSNLPKSS